MNRNFRRLGQIMVVYVFCQCLGPFALAQTKTISPDQPPATPAESTKFLRMTTGDDGAPLALQTSVVRYRSKDQRLLVDLIAAIHVGDAHYYKQLNRQFDEYEVVLYELVAPEGTKIPADRDDMVANPISWLQKSIQSLLGLESQIEQVDYQKTNFVHADMSPADIAAKMQERGDTPLTVGMTAFAELLREQNKRVQTLADDQQSNGAGATDSVDSVQQNALEMLAEPHKLRVAMARQFAQSGALELGLGETLNRMLITDRNQAALKVLEKQIAAGKTKIAIFYGAAHMPDFEQQLVRNFGLNRTKQVWVDAWDLQRPVTTSATNPAALLMRILRELR